MSKIQKWPISTCKDFQQHCTFGKCTSKTTMRYFTSTRKEKNNDKGKDVEKLEPSDFAIGNVAGGSSNS